MLNGYVPYFTKAEWTGGLNACGSFFLACALMRWLMLGDEELFPEIKAWEDCFEVN